LICCPKKTPPKRRGCNRLPIVDPVDRCQLRTGRGHKVRSENRPSVRTGGSRDHEHVSVAAGTLEPLGAWLRPNISRPACQFTPGDAPDNLKKLVAVVTRARIVSELSLVILSCFLPCERRASAAPAPSTLPVRAIPVPDLAVPNQNRCLHPECACPVTRIVLVPDEFSMSRLRHNCCAASLYPSFAPSLP
jgi:hypothetical protein